MFSLSLRERLLVTAVLSAAVLGAAVKHWRDTRREAQALPPAAVAHAGPPGASRYSLVRSSHGQPYP